MTSSTAAANSGRMLRMFSSAFGDRRTKFSQASYSIADGDVEPGRNTDTEDAMMQMKGVKKTISVWFARTWYFLYEITDVGPDDTDTVDLGYGERGSKVQEP